MFGSTTKEDQDTLEQINGKAFEDVIRKNVETIVNYSKDTREKFRDLETKFKQLEATVEQRDNAIAQLKQQVANLQTKVFSGGTEV